MLTVFVELGAGGCSSHMRRRGRAARCDGQMRGGKGPEGDKKESSRKSINSPPVWGVFGAEPRSVEPETSTEL